MTSRARFTPLRPGGCRRRRGSFPVTPARAGQARIAALTSRVTERDELVRATGLTRLRTVHCVSGESACWA
jgi:hypothetical protein